jgi:hypothetical protein
MCNSLKITAFLRALDCNTFEGIQAWSTWTHSRVCWICTRQWKHLHLGEIFYNSFIGCSLCIFPERKSFFCFNYNFMEQEDQEFAWLSIFALNSQLFYCVGWGICHISLAMSITLLFSWLYPYNTHMQEFWIISLTVNCYIT